MRGKSLFFEKKCEVCNKLLYPTVMWAYKISNPPEKTKYYCSWSCLRKGKQQLEKINEHRRRKFSWRNGSK